MNDVVNLIWSAIALIALFFGYNLYQDKRNEKYHQSKDREAIQKIKDRDIDINSAYDINNSNFS